ncbi:uncharacterized protein V1516DRAFT_687960 [Lipomyces oligophaga]|uniref:uncharacterized protein n=1 Tax=Lipomyces oligophaga TaxID=45792 RepID=UPI0034CFA36C
MSSLILEYYEVFLTESDVKALGGEDVNQLNVPKDWPDLADGLWQSHFWQPVAKKQKCLDLVATQKCIFDDPMKSDALGLNVLYKALPPFDVKARWSWREERQVMRKVNIKVMVPCLMSVFPYIMNADRIQAIRFSYIRSDLNLQIDLADGNLYMLVFVFLLILLSKFVRQWVSFQVVASVLLLVGGVGSAF